MGGGHIKIESKHSDPGERGHAADIPVGMLNVDHEHYQRDPERTKTLVDRICRNFTWSLFGTLDVAKRADGSMWVYDGQHRLLAAKKRNMSTVPCMVHDFDSLEEEAEAFVESNTRRKSVTSVAKYKAGSFAGLEPHASIKAWLDSVGMRVSEAGSNDPSTFRYIGTFHVAWNGNRDAAKRALLTTRDVCSSINHESDSSLFRALYWLAKNGVNIEGEMDRLVANGLSMPMVRSKIQTYAFSRNASVNDNTCGRALLSIINYRKQKRNKIRIPGDGDDDD